MKKRILFIIVYTLCFPISILAIFIACIHIPLIPIVWIITGDEEKSFDIVFGGIQGWLVSLPYKIVKL